MEFMTESFLLQTTCWFTGISTIVECDEPVKWRLRLYSHRGQMYTLVFLPLILCEKAKAVNSQLR